MVPFVDPMGIVIAEDEGQISVRIRIMSLGFGAPEASAYFGKRVWVNAKNEVVKYNLAFLLPHLFAQDNGRVSRVILPQMMLIMQHLVQAMT